MKVGHYIITYYKTSYNKDKNIFATYINHECKLNNELLYISDEEDDIISDYLNIEKGVIRDGNYIDLNYNELEKLINFCEQLSKMKLFI